MQGDAGAQRLVAFVAAAPGALLSLLKWKVHPDRIENALNNVIKLDGEEIVKVHFHECHCFSLVRQAVFWDSFFVQVCKHIILICVVSQTPVLVIFYVWSYISTVLFSPLNGRVGGK